MAALLPLPLPPCANRSGLRNTSAGCVAASSAANRYASPRLAAGNTVEAPLSSHSWPIGTSRAIRNVHAASKQGPRAPGWNAPGRPARPPG